VDVIAHKHIGVDGGSGRGGQLMEQAEKRRAVDAIDEAGATVIATPDDV
jgi:hypothetical protein